MLGNVQTELCPRNCSTHDFIAFPIRFLEKISYLFTKKGVLQSLEELIV